MMLGRGLQALANLFTKRSGEPDRLYASLITEADLASGKYRSPQGREVVARVRQIVQQAVQINVSACASARLRLYRRAGADGSKALWPHGRIVVGKRRNDYLRNPAAGFGPGRKAAAYAEDAGEIEEVLQHPALSLMRNPNPLDRGGSVFFQSAFAQMEYFGRRFVYFTGRRGAPELMWVLQGHDARFIPSRDGVYGGVAYGRNGTALEHFTPDESWYHRFWPSPFNPWEGIGPLQSVLVEADIFAYSTEAESASWENGARPDYAITVPPDKVTTPTQVDEMTARINAMLRGPKQRGKFMVLTAADVKPLAFTPKEMEYIQGRENIRSLIFGAFGVPEPIYKMADSNRASSLMALEQHARLTVLPRLCLDSEAWTETLLREYGIEPGEYWFAYDNPVQEDREALRSDVQAFVPLRVWTRNEARAELGYEPMDGLDEFDPGPGDMAGTDPLADLLADPVADDPTDDVGGEKSRCSCCSPRDTKDDRRPADPILDRIAALIRGWLVEMGTDAALSADGTIDLAKHSQALAALLQEPLDEVLKRSMRAALGRAGRPVVDMARLFNADAAEAARNIRIRLAGDLAKTTIESIRDIIAQGVDRTLPVQEIAGQVAAALEDRASTRATVIARTEYARAQSMGAVLGARRVGGGVKLRLAPNACAYCRGFVKAFNRTLKPGELFARTGDSFVDADGKTHTLTRDVESTPLHPNDRCGTEIVIPTTGEGASA